MSPDPSFEYAGDGHPGNDRAGQAGRSSITDSTSDGPTGVEWLRGLLSTLWGGKWVVLAVLALVVGAMAAYTFTRTPQYETSTLLLVDLGQSQSVVPSLTGERSGTSSFGGQERSLSNQIFVINQSESLARKVARRLDTMRTHPRTGEPLDLLTTPTGERRSRSALAGLLLRRVRAQSAKREVDAIRITAQGPVPEETALLADQYASAYIDRTRKKSRESMQARHSFLEEQADKYERRVDKADQALANYMQEEDAVSLDQESSRLVQQLSQREGRHDELRIELDMAESALNTKKSELERIRPRLAERLSSGIQTELKQVQQERANVAAEINRVKTRKPNLEPDADTPQARDLRQLQRRAERLDRQADSLADAYVEKTLAAGGIGAGGDGEESGSGRGISYVVRLQREIAQQEIKVNGLRAQINTIERQIEDNRTRLQNLPPKSIKLADLKRRKQSLEQTHSFIQQKLQETRMSIEEEVGFAERIRSAGVPLEPISPNSQRNLLLAALIGLTLGGALVVLRQKLDTYVRTPQDLKALGEHVVGIIPSMDPMIESKFDGSDTTEIDGREIQTSLIMLTIPTSAAAESYRRLRTNLRFARPDADLRSMVVTSPGRKREGKTTTAANLALVQAEGGQRTLLVDADLRDPKVHEYLDVPRSPGLTEALYDPPEPSDLLAPAEDLRVLPGGETVPNPSEQLGAQRMRHLLATMEQAFDLVIVDATPMLLFSDALRLGTHTDGALVVASANETDGPALKQISSQFDEVNVPRLGVVLNRFRPDQQRAGYGYGYGYGYGGYGYGYGQYDDETLDSYRNGTNGRRRSIGDRVRAWWNGG